MEFNSCASKGPSLFPAYSVPVQQNADENNAKDWLCNSSYTPSNYQKPPIKQEELSKSDEELDDEKSKKKKKRKKAKKERSKKSTVPPLESYHVPESDSIRSHLNKKIFIEETGLSYERAFRIDSNCDTENIYFDHLEQKNIAKYKSYPNVPFGFTPKEQSLWPRFLNKGTKQDTPRYFSKKALKMLMKNNEPISVIKDTQAPDVILEFIPLSLNSKQSHAFQKQVKADFGISTSWKSESFKGKESSTEVSNDDIKDNSIDFELRNRTISFNQKLSESPHDVQLWLNFVNFQQELHNSKGSKMQSESYLVEKKIAILDKALKHNPKSVLLNMAKLKLCQSVWKIDKVIASWDNLIFINPNNPQVWQEYIVFVLTNLTYFSTQRVLKVFSKCIRTLSNLSEGIIQSHSPPPDLIYNMLDIFSQLCFVLKSCGYVEKAVAAYQALIEFTLFNIPETESLSVSESISIFEPFWDSGAGRFGEEGAIGWDATVSQRKITFNKIVTQSDLSHAEDDILCNKAPEWEIWLAFERLREFHNWLPWRPNPEYEQTADDIDDIDRTVSFDEISKFLFRISEEEHKFLLLENFVKFLGFNSHMFGCSGSLGKSANTFIHINNFDAISKQFFKDSLFSDQELCPLYLKTDASSEERMNFVKNIFSQAVTKFSFSHKILISRMWLIYLQKIALDPNNTNETLDSIKKFAKNMLKESENRNCLLLWYEFIKILISNGSKATAKKTFGTLLASSTQAVTTSGVSMKELWYFIRSFIDSCLGIQDGCVPDSDLFSQSEIIWLLILIGSREKYVPYSHELIKPTQILKAVSGFKSLLNEELSSLQNMASKLCYCLDPCAYSYIDCLKCYAYLQYFSQGLDAALQVFKDTYQLLKEKLKEPSKNYILEQLCICQGEFLNFHTKNSTTSMKPLLSFLYKSVEEYPKSIRLLHFLVKWRSDSSVVGPTRRFFAKILNESCRIEPITWIFALASEFSVSYLIAEQLNENVYLPEMAVAFSGIKNKIRSLYERALKSSCAYIPIVWRSYIKFEMLNNEREKAKSIFHRGLQNGGWSKELMMDGVEYFPTDLKQILDFMTEKQIRIHTPLEEITLLMEHGVQNL